MSRWSPLLTVLALSLVTPACSSNDAMAPNEGADDPSSHPSDAPAVAFSEAAIALVPGESRTVGVRVSPASKFGASAVQLSLVGDSGGAFLDTGVVTTDLAGEGSFTLTAPSTRADFRVRATLGSSSAELAVVVSGFGTGLYVWPLYTGARKIESWTATVSLDGKCDDETGVVYTDGPFVSETSVGLPAFETIPVGVPLKVTVRSGHYVGGCVDARASFGHILDRLVFVTATDLPLQLGNADIRVKLGLDSGDGWAAAWSDVVDEIVERFVSKKSDAAALLDAMYAACHPTAAPSFTNARGKAAWDLKLASSFHSLLGVGDLTRTLRSFLTTGVGADGRIALEGKLTSSRSPGGKATLALSAIGGVSAAKASLSPSLDVTWASGTGDRVLFGGSVAFEATSLAAQLGEAVALDQVSGATSFPSALSKSLSCSDVASVLVGSTGTEFAYGSCGEFCVVSLCEAALESMWANAVEPSGKKSALELSASGTVSALSETAAPLDFDGTWVGTATVAGRQARVSGKASGATERTSVP